MTGPQVSLDRRFVGRRQATADLEAPHLPVADDGAATKVLLAGRLVAVASLGDASGLPCVYAGDPFPTWLSPWAQPWVVGLMGVTQGEHVRPVLCDPCADLVSSADGSVTRDDDVDAVRHALEQPQPYEVVRDGVVGSVEVVEHRDEDIRQHVDAQLRYDRQPVGSLQGLAPDRVLALGSLSKTLAPGIRLGWLLVPPALAGSVVRERLLTSRGAPALDQLALATLMQSGRYDRHVTHIDRTPVRCPIRSSNRPIPGRALGVRGPGAHRITDPGTCEVGSLSRAVVS